jgi:hypothetical protein
MKDPLSMTDTISKATPNLESESHASKSENTTEAEGDLVRRS